MTVAPLVYFPDEESRFCNHAMQGEVQHAWILFNAPVLKGPPGVSSVWIVHLSVCLYVIPCHYVKYNIFSLCGHTVTKLGQ